jgi:acetoin utilization deacetylase AcuC-like enzyme
LSVPIVYHPDYVVPLPDSHRFPMSKFRMLYELLLTDELVTTERVFAPILPPTEWLELVHDPAYIQAYYTGTLDPKALRRIGLPWSPELVNRTCIALGGSILTAKLAIEHGIACNTAGGTHHAFANMGSGFCIFNDLAIASRVVQKLGLAKKILIVDLDVHQGDGTAAIFQHDPSVFTFSMHCDINFPSKKQTSDLDVPLREGMEDAEYLKTLAEYLPDLLSQVKPDLVLYDAGVDPHISDRLGKLALTNTGIFDRDLYVLDTCVSQGYPVACVIGGGYAEDIPSLVYRHSLLHRSASNIYRKHRL